MVFVWMIVLAASLKAGNTDARSRAPINIISLKGDVTGPTGQGVIVSWNSTSALLSSISTVTVSSSTYSSSTHTFTTVTPTQAEPDDDLNETDEDLAEADDDRAEADDDLADADDDLAKIDSELSSSLFLLRSEQNRKPLADAEKGLMESSTRSKEQIHVTNSTQTLPVDVPIVTSNETAKDWKNYTAPRNSGSMNGCNWMLSSSATILLAMSAAFGLATEL